MGRIVVSEFVTLDGVFEDPGGGETFEQGGWSFQFDRGKDGDRFKFDELMAADAQLLGRVTYAGFAQAWPRMTDADEFGERMNGMPKYVVSQTLSDEDADWSNSTVIRGDVTAGIERLKEQVENDILVAGSARLVRTLTERRLVDEYRLMVFPIVLGAGRRLFEEGAARSVLTLADAKPVGPEGVFVLTYRPKQQDAAE